MLAPHDAGNEGNAVAQLTIRQLDDEVITRLRQRAARAGHSMEQEARELLTRATMPDRQQVVAMLRAHRAGFGDRVFSDSGELVRQMRDERSGLR
jgi:plasmid stability protein